MCVCVGSDQPCVEYMPPGVVTIVLRPNPSCIDSMAFALRLSASRVVASAVPSQNISSVNLRLLTDEGMAPRSLGVVTTLFARAAPAPKTRLRYAIVFRSPVPSPSLIDCSLDRTN